jgi:transmembrane sensor
MKKLADHIDYILLGKKLSGETTTEEEKLIRDWLNQNERNKNLFMKLEQVYHNSEAYRYATGIDLNTAMGKIRNHKQPGTTAHLRFLFRIAAILLIFAGGTFVGFRIMHSMRYIVMETGKGQHNTQILMDGTEVTLNEKSTLRYPKNYGRSSRKVELQGEAYFVVTRNSELPFVVKTNIADIRVLGTEFNVNAVKPDRVTVMVNRGKVELSPLKSPVGKNCFIEKGFEGTYNSRSKKCSVRAIADENAIAWKTRQLKFKNTSLPEVLDKLEKVYSIHFIANEKIKERKLTAVFYNQPLDSIIEILKTALNTDIKKQHNNEYVFVNE